MACTPSTLPTAAPHGPDAVREAQPLVQCLTNTVTVGLVANALLAIGAAPAMADVPGEAGPMVLHASAVLINLGTPATEQRAAMLEAALACAEHGRPWVLDPVAVGVLPVRTALAQRLVALRPTIVRGNASEIKALAGGAAGRGVDAAHSVDDALDDARALAAVTGGVVAVSGPVDLITDGDRVSRVANGHPLLTRMTGGGCALGGVMAAFAATHADAFDAATLASAAYGVAAERAAATASGPGTFAAGLLDELAALQSASFQRMARIA